MVHALSVKMLWYLPFASLVAGVLTRTALQVRQHAQVTDKGKDWWLLLALGWIPVLAWLLSQVVPPFE